jgi:FkbM family methyltransferase
VDTQGTLRRVGAALHSVIARSPVAGPYLEVVGTVSRATLPRWAAQRLHNSVLQGGFPELELRPRDVRLGNVAVRLVPHLGEFDAEALFNRWMSYERDVFAFMEPLVPGYDYVLEIGANVGVFSVFFSALTRGTIISIEPSAEAFRRLLENLRLNHCRNVHPVNAMVSGRTGLREFFEPRGHLTNGSIDPAFASLFSGELERRWVPSLSGAELAQMLPSGRGLVKIDTEGAEAEVLESLAPLLLERRPDLLVEVLPEFESRIESLEIMGHYRRHTIATGCRDVYFQWR